MRPLGDDLVPLRRASRALSVVQYKESLNMTNLKKASMLAAMSAMIAVMSGMIITVGVISAGGVQRLPFVFMSMAMFALGVMVGTIGSGVVVLKAVEEQQAS